MILPRIFCRLKDQLGLIVEMEKMPRACHLCMDIHKDEYIYFDTRGSPEYRENYACFATQDDARIVIQNERFRKWLVLE